MVSGWAYVAGGVAGLHVVDVSDPAAPKLRGSLSTGGMTEGVRVNGQTAVVIHAGGLLRTIDVSDARAPLPRGMLDLRQPGEGWGAPPFIRLRALDLGGDTAHVAGIGVGWAIVDVKAPGAPRYVARDVVWSGDHIYLSFANGEVHALRGGCY